jgi:hypothetical protein
MSIKGLLAIRRDNGAPLAICDVTVQGWQHRETVDAETFRARYFTERERDLLAALRALSRVVAQTDTQGLCRTEWLSAQIAIAACEVQS